MNIALVILIAGITVFLATYMGTKMALQSFFGPAFADSDTGEFTLPNSELDDSAESGDS